MDYAQKYRVKRFKDICGNEDTLRLLKSRVKKKVLPDLIAFYGEPGTCKTTMSYLLIMAMRCTSPTGEGEPCGQCDSCQTVLDTLYSTNLSARGTNIFVYSMAQEEDQDANIQAILSLLKAPNLRGSERWIIINELHNCTFKKQQNFLVPFEGIPKGTHVIITTTDWLSKIASGLRSRAKSYQLTKANVEELLTRLDTVARNEGLKVTKENLRKLIRVKDCNMRECLNTLEDISLDADATWSILLKEYSTNLEEFINFVKASKGGTIQLIDYVTKAESPVTFLYSLPNTIFKAISLKDVADQIVESDLRKRLNEQTVKISTKKLNDINRSLVDLNNTSEDDARRMLFMIGCEINEEIFKQVTHTDIENSLNVVDKTIVTDKNVKVYDANFNESSGAVTKEGVMKWVQNSEGEVDIEDIEGDNNEEDDAFDLSEIEEDV